MRKYFDFNDFVVDVANGSLGASLLHNEPTGTGLDFLLWQTAEENQSPDEEISGRLQDLTTAAYSQPQTYKNFR